MDECIGVCVKLLIWRFEYHQYLCSYLLLILLSSLEQENYELGSVCHIRMCVCANERKNELTIIVPHSV